ncbi:MAG: helix-turn-helix domain-containing protein [Rhodobacteraceae bacterium]|nr:helix-turn-helix domain-containing protein [Paracoccaceae bacterium]
MPDMDRVTPSQTALSWLPQATRWYLAHTEEGCSLRALARRAWCAPSTVLRQVRRVETRRDDPLIDDALTRLGALTPTQTPHKETPDMTATLRQPRQTADEATITREARRILRRLSEPGAFLAIARDLEKAAVMREGADGQTTRIAVVDRAVAEAFALKDWIMCRSRGRVTVYAITQAGRAALKRLLAAQSTPQPGLAEAATPFAEQHRDWDTRTGEKAERIRYNRAESPLSILARRREKDGTPFLSPDLVAAGERLREDFEIAQMGPRVAQNWDRFLTGGDRGGFSGSGGPGDGPRAARDRVAAALRDLGPGLGDVVLRCCCFLEGMEQAEKRMGWSARSGKIVLRIALQRLKRHYERLGEGAGMIG